LTTNPGPNIHQIATATVAHSARWLEQDTNPAWPAPQPVTALLEAAPYPADALPPALKAANDEVQAFTQSPYALVANSALAALALVAQGLADVRRASQLTSPTSLFLLTIAESGERKSATDDRFLAPVRQWEQEQREGYIPLAKEYRATLEAWESKKAGVKDRIRQEAKSGKPTAEFKR
jgi:putative DNA primase/helicase